MKQHLKHIAMINSRHASEHHFYNGEVASVRAAPITAILALKLSGGVSSSTICIPRQSDERPSWSL